MTKPITFEESRRVSACAGFRGYKSHSPAIFSKRLGEIATRDAKLKSFLGKLPFVKKV